MEGEFSGSIGFQWDAGNNDKNLLKHNVQNWECEQIFFQHPLIVLEDAEHSLTEKRWVAMGKTDGDRHLVIIFTRRDHLLRIISARDMDRKERRYYEENK